MPINGLGAHLKRVRSGDRGNAHDRVDDQSLGRSCDTFPGSCVGISHDTQGDEVSCDWTCDRSGDSFPGSRGQVLRSKALRCDVHGESGDADGHKGLAPLVISVVP